MDKLTEKMIKQDPIIDAEKAFGKHWSEFDDTENMFMLSHAIESNERKGSYLASIGDTYSRISWDDFKSLLVKKGFISAIEYDIHQDGNTDEFILYYNPEKGLIIHADSYWNKKSINSGTLYGEIQANSEEDVREVYRWISTGGCIDTEKLIFETSHDVREGLFSRLDAIETAGKFLPVWTNKDRFLWFLDYTETKAEDYDYKQITKDKIEKCPDGLKNIIYGTT